MPKMRRKTIATRFKARAPLTDATQVGILAGWSIVWSAPQPAHRLEKKRDSYAEEGDHSRRDAHRHYGFPHTPLDGIHLECRVRLRIHQKRLLPHRLSRTTAAASRALCMCL